MRFPKRHKVVYLAFLVPFVLAFFSWLYFPSFALWIIRNVFSHTAAEQPANIVWYGTIRFFYTWFTFVAIGVAGAWVVAAVFARHNHNTAKTSFYPMVSFMVPAFNQEKNIAGCVRSLFRCAEKYDSLCEITVIDDGSTDYTYEVAWSAIQLGRAEHPQIRGKVVRHTANLGKIESLRTGINRSLGGVIAIVDADSEWEPNTLVKLVDYKLLNGKKAVTGYAHPNGQGSEGNLYVTLQRLEYSQGLAVGRCAQGLGDNVLVVSGAVGVYDADMLRDVLSERNIRSVTEDLEITLEMHKKGAKIGYVSDVQSATVAPFSLRTLWHQRLRWFTGWLHNTLGIHRDLMGRRSWLTALILYCYVFEFVGAFVDLAALVAFPFLLVFAPDRLLFAFNLLVFIPYGLFIGVVGQAIALRFAYGSVRYKWLLFYTPLYPVLRLVNMFARSRSVVSYLMGNNGKWHVS